MAQTDPHLIRQFMRTFYGYGSYHAPFWFVGMEEGGDNSLAQFYGKLEKWQARGERAIEDLPEKASDEGWAEVFFGRNAKSQSTWNKLIRVLLAASGERSVALKQVKNYQREKLGRSNGETCLLELFPLPSPNINSWIYADTGLDELQDRATYQATVVEQRLAGLRQMIETYRPKNVIFYGTGYRHWWQRITVAPYASKDGFSTAKNPHTNFIIMRHPTSFGVSNQYCQNIGEWLHSQSDAME